MNPGEHTPGRRPNVPPAAKSESHTAAIETASEEAREALMMRAYRRANPGAAGNDDAVHAQTFWDLRQDGKRSLRDCYESYLAKHPQERMALDPVTIDDTLSLLERMRA